MPVSSIKKKTPISGNPFPGCLHHFPTGLAQASWRWRLWVANSWVLANFSGSPGRLGDFWSYRLLTAQTSESKIIWWFVMWRECGSRRVQKAPEWVEGERRGPPHLPAPFPWCPLSPDVSQASVCFISIGEQLSSACEVWVFDPGPKSESVFITLDRDSSPKRRQVNLLDLQFVFLWESYCLRRSHYSVKRPRSSKTNALHSGFPIARKYPLLTNIVSSRRMKALGKQSLQWTNLLRVLADSQACRIGGQDGRCPGGYAYVLNGPWTKTLILTLWLSPIFYLIPFQRQERQIQKAWKLTSTPHLLIVWPWKSHLKHLGCFLPHRVSGLGQTIHHPLRSYNSHG